MRISQIPNALLISIPVLTICRSIAHYNSLQGTQGVKSYSDSYMYFYKVYVAEK